MRRPVLVIEDNEKNLYLLTFLLEKSGLRVISARDGANGIELAKQTGPALVILDIQLPSMDGYAVAKALRDCEQCRTIPIVAVTSYAMPGDRERALEAGCNSYIEKPIDPDGFVNEVRRFL